MRILGPALLVSLTLSIPTIASPRVKTRSDIVEEKIDVPVFGKVRAFHPRVLDRSQGLVLFVSGDGGFNLGVVDMADRLAPRMLVVGLPMDAWRKIAEKSKGSCWYPAGDIETIAQVVEKRYAFPRYVPPVLVGYSSGATLVYGVLAQAPPESFAGAVSLGFCADLEVARRFCGKGDWKPTYDDKKHVSWLPAHAALTPVREGGPRWIALQGQIDKVCDPKAVTEFAANVPNSRLVPLEKVGHGFSVPKNWGETFDRSVASLLGPVTPWQPLPREHAETASTPTEIEAKLDALDLPLEISWPERAAAVLIFVSGDGGWAELDREIAQGLTRQGIAVVGWNTLRYFWHAKTPDGFRADLARVVDALPEEAAVFAGGYSFGAEVVPVTLAEKSLPRLLGLVLLGPSPYASFEVSPLDWVRADGKPTPYSVRRALETNRGAPILCLRSASDTDSGCPPQSRPEVTVVEVPGGHHFAGDFEALAERISAFMTAHREGSSAAR